MKTIIKTILSAYVVAFLIAPALAQTAHAAPNSKSICPDGSTAQDVTPVTFFPAWYDGIYCVNDKGVGTVASPGAAGFGDNTATRFGTWASIIAMNVVRLIMMIVGYTSIAFIIWGGFKFMINGDNSAGTVSARKTIQNAVIGLVLSMSSVAIVTFIVSRIV